MRRFAWGVVFFLFLNIITSVWAGEAMAQNAGGRILGNITDQTGASISGAQVTVTNIATQISQQTTTDTDGFYQVPGLPIGVYRVTVELSGFQQEVFENQSLQINQSLRVDAKLAIGTKNEVVEVKDQASGVETTNSTVGGTVTGAAIQQAPLNGRNVLNLALLEPGVTESNSDNSGAGDFSVAGVTDSVTFYWTAD